MTDKEIITCTLRALPVGNLNTHTPESIPERVAYFVSQYAMMNDKLERIEDLLATINEPNSVLIQRIREILTTET